MSDLAKSSNMPADARFSEGWPSFSRDWFTAHVLVWERILVPQFKDKPATGLEVGCYEGRSCLWLLANVLTHPDSRIHCVDIWSHREIEQTFDRNVAVSGASHKVIKRKGDAVEMLRYTPGCDFAYIDADHTARACVVQAGLVWPRLKSGGVLIFDDYPWTHPDIQHPPKPGIDAFLTFWEGQYDLLHKEWQVILRKR